MRIHDKKFLEFPLCLLAVDDPEILDKIISYSIVAYSLKIEKAVESRIFRVRDFPKGFDIKNEEHRRILLAGDELNITIASVNDKIITFNELDTYVQKCICDYGKQPYCRIGKKLCFEVRDKTFDENMFRILCAIQSKIGNKKSNKKMYKDEIRCRAFGCKTAKMLQKEKPNHYIYYSDKKMKRITDLLEAKQLISKFTYKRRITYYSTRLNKEQLYEQIKKEKLYWEEKKLNILDANYSRCIEEEIEILKRERKRLRIIRMKQNDNPDRKYGTS